MLKSFNQRAEREVAFRQKHAHAIATVARFLAADPLAVAAELSKKAHGGRVPVYERGGHVGYA